MEKKLVERVVREASVIYVTVDVTKGEILSPSVYQMLKNLKPHRWLARNVVVLINHDLIIYEGSYNLINGVKNKPQTDELENLNSKNIIDYVKNYFEDNFNNEFWMPSVQYIPINLDIAKVNVLKKKLINPQLLYTESLIKKLNNDFMENILIFHKCYEAKMNQNNNSIGEVVNYDSNSYDNTLYNISDPIVHEETIVSHDFEVNDNDNTVINFSDPIVHEEKIIEENQVINEKNLHYRSQYFKENNASSSYK